CDFWRNEVEIIMQTLSAITKRLFNPAPRELRPPNEEARGVSLVLSGGGARSFAHIGVLRALEEARIPIAQIGGTSGGALIAAQVALGWDAEKIRQTMRRYFVERGSPLDYGLPFVSLADGKHLRRMLEEMFGELRIEDLPRRFFCVSCNLNRAELVVHETGLLRKAVGASNSVPGLLPPVAAEGELLVDGCLLNNLPVDVMKRYAPDWVWAVDVSDKAEVTVCPRYSASLPSWKIWWSRLNPFAAPIKAPTALDVLLNAIMIASRRQAELNRQLADVYLSPPVEASAAFDFKPFDEIVEVGYHYARQSIAAAQRSARSNPTLR